MKAGLSIRSGIKERRKVLKMLSGLTIGHMTNDFYRDLLPIFIPAIIATFSLKYSMAGFLLFSMYIITAVLSPAIGYYADVKGMIKFAIIAGLLIFGIMYPVLGMATSF